jgi:uncharacterized membrane protein YhhN
MNSKYWYYLFFADLLAELTAIAKGWNELRLFTKPMLMIILFAWFISASIKFSPLRHYIAAALFFSWLGDVFLLVEEKNPWSFIAGLGSFLVAHIMYILFFLRLRDKQFPQKPWNLFVVAGVMTYAATLFIFLYPHIGDLKVPVAVYALAISVMLITATHAFNNYNRKAERLCVSGAVLFVISDSLLSVNKFYTAFPAADICIMLSYALAQFAITKGSLQYLAGIKTRHDSMPEIPGDEA